MPVEIKKPASESASTPTPAPAAEPKLSEEQKSVVETPVDLGNVNAPEAIVKPVTETAKTTVTPNIGEQMPPVKEPVISETPKEVGEAEVKKTPVVEPQVAPVEEKKGFWSFLSFGKPKTKAQEVVESGNHEQIEDIAAQTPPATDSETPKKKI